MRTVIQRVSEASVTIENQIHGTIAHGLLILIGITADDTEEDVLWLAAKIANLRIFSDSEGLMNLSIKETGGDVLLISQFTLHAKTKKGNRPSFIEAARPEVAVPLYEKFRIALEKELGKPLQTGKFGADMKVRLLNDGPVTLIIDTKNKA